MPDTGGLCACMVRCPSRSNKSLIIKVERVKGIEPSSSAWKAVALPLSYTRAGNSRQTSLTRSCVFPRPTSASPGMVGEVGLEPTKA
jgi:hypothetical protein